MSNTKVGADVKKYCLFSKDKTNVIAHCRVSSDRGFLVRLVFTFTV